VCHFFFFHFKSIPVAWHWEIYDNPMFAFLSITTTSFLVQRDGLIILKQVGLPSSSSNTLPNKLLNLRTCYRSFYHQLIPPLQTHTYCLTLFSFLISSILTISFLYSLINVTFQPSLPPPWFLLHLIVLLLTHRVYSNRFTSVTIMPSDVRFCIKPSTISTIFLQSSNIKHHPVPQKR